MEISITYFQEKVVIFIFENRFNTQTTQHSIYMRVYEV